MDAESGWMRKHGLEQQGALEDACKAGRADADAQGHEEENDPKPFIKYMLGVILACYREFENRAAIAEDSGARSTSYDIVKKYVRSDAAA